jgi:hypothetical protein
LACGDLFGVFFRPAEARSHHPPADADLHVVSRTVAVFAGDPEFDGLATALCPVVQIGFEIDRFVDFVDRAVAPEHVKYGVARGFESVVEVECTDEGFKGVADDRFLDVRATHLRDDKPRKSEFGAEEVEGLAVDDLRLPLRQGAFLFGRKLAEEESSNDQIKHRIAQEFETFVRHAARRVAVQHGRMAEGFVVVIAVADAQPELVSDEGI